MPIVATTDEQIGLNSAVPLARYAQLIGYSENQFFGVYKEGDQEYGCKTIWIKSERVLVAKYLEEAQSELEDFVSYPLAPRWITGERHPNGWKILANFGKIIAGGFKATASIASGVALDHTSDPSEITGVPTTVTDTAEVHFYHPGTTVEITPSEVVISGGLLSAKFPRARLVTIASQDNDRAGLSYIDTTPTGVFEQTMDVARVYNNPSSPATFIWPHGEDCSCSNDCEEDTETGCILVHNKDIGIVEARLETSALCACDKPDYIEINYYAGLEEMNSRVEDAIIRLAHAKMPSTPCGCDTARLMWERDYRTPQGTFTPERINCPFGLSDGAWAAYSIAKRLKIYKSMVL